MFPFIFLLSLFTFFSIIEGRAVVLQPPQLTYGSEGVVSPSIEEKYIKGGSGGPKLTKNFEKHGGSMGGSWSSNFVSKQNRRKGSRGLGSHFPPSYPGVTPPRVSAGRVRQVWIFSEKKNCKKIQLGEKNDKKIFFQNRFPYCILIVWNLH